MARSIDDLAEFEEFRLNLLPMLRRMVLEDWSPERMRREVGPYMQARVVQMALLGDPGKISTLTAARDILDREEGKATQRAEVTHKYANMGKAELAALALQKLINAGIVSPNGHIVENVGPLATSPQTDDSSTDS